MPRRPQPLLIRITHWINVPAFVVMAMSGLQIWIAYPFFGPRGAQWDWVPLAGWIPPAWMRAGQWLAGARHLHFAFAWLLVLNALVYFVYLGVSGEWRRRLFWPRRDAQGLYGRLQRVAYTSALVLGVLEVLSGFALWKPVQLRWLGALFGGYDGARVVHFLALIGLLVFLVAHVVMAGVHWRRSVDMITGGKPHEEA